MIDPESLKAAGYRSYPPADPACDGAWQKTICDEAAPDIHNN